MLMSTATDSDHRFWGERAASSTLAEYEQVFEAQRNQIQALQNQVSGLLHEKTFLRAATASDVRSFCLHYLSSSGSCGGSISRNSSNHNTTTTTSMPATTATTAPLSRCSLSTPLARLRHAGSVGGGGGHLHHVVGADTESIPVYDLLLFLHRYSNGLVPAPENKRKRMRSSSITSAIVNPSSTSINMNNASAAPSPRLLQRMLTRQRFSLDTREDSDRK